MKESILLQEILPATEILCVVEVILIELKKSGLTIWNTAYFQTNPNGMLLFWTNQAVNIIVGVEIAMIEDEARFRIIITHERERLVTLGSPVNVLIELLQLLIVPGPDLDIDPEKASRLETLTGIEFQVRRIQKTPGHMLN